MLTRRIFLALSQPGEALIERLGLWESDLVLLMPVRITQAKNIEYAIQVTAALKQRESSLHCSSLVRLIRMTQQIWNIIEACRNSVTR